MKFDSIIIGAGLAGVTTALRLAEEGRKVALISAGRSSMHFNSGSFGLMGFDSGHNAVESFNGAFDSLPQSHPYVKAGIENISALSADAMALLRRAGVKMQGVSGKNHTRISPLGILRPAWQTLENILTLENLEQLPKRHVAIINPIGFLDFYPRFIATALTDLGFTCEIIDVDNADLRRMRSSASEMRAANLARFLTGDALVKFADVIAHASKKSDAAALILPAIVNFDKTGESIRLRQIIGRQLFYAPTMGVSVPGISIHTRLMRYFMSLGGQLFNGHRVTRADFDNNILKAVYTDKLDDDALRADNFVLATGGFFSKGLRALPNEVVELTLGLDTSSCADTERFTSDIFESQPLAAAGVMTDTSFHAIRGGKTITNLYAAGSILEGADSRREDSGAGVALVSSLCIAKNIINHI